VRASTVQENSQLANGSSTHFAIKVAFPLADLHPENQDTDQREQVWWVGVRKFHNLLSLEETVREGRIGSTMPNRRVRSRISWALTRSAPTFCNVEVDKSSFPDCSHVRMWSVLNFDGYHKDGSAVQF
jgi:hypothetical protein